MERFLREHLKLLIPQCRVVALVGATARSGEAGDDWGRVLPPEFRPWDHAAAVDAPAQGLDRAADDLAAELELQGDEVVLPALRQLLCVVQRLAAPEPEVEQPLPRLRVNCLGHDEEGAVLTLELSGPADQPRAGLRALALVQGAALDRGLVDAVVERAGERLAAADQRHYLFVIEPPQEAVDDDQPPPVTHALTFGDPGGQHTSNMSGLVRRHIQQDEELDDQIRTGIMLPAPPPHFGRDRDIEDLVQHVIGDSPPPIPVLGAPGIGKRSVCLAALHDERVKARFGGRRFFARCDAVLTGAGVLGEIGRTVGLPPGPDLENRLLAELSRDPVLLVLEGVMPPWEGDPSGTEEVLTNLSRIYGVALVVTLDGTRRPLGPRWGRAILVSPLGMTDARRLFISVTAPRFAGDPVLEDLLVAQEGVPLSIEILGRALRQDQDLSGVWSGWQRVRAELLRRPGWAYGLASIIVTIHQVLAGQRMSDPARRLLALIPVFPHGIAHGSLELLLPTEGMEAAETLLELGLAFFDEEAHLRALPAVRRYASLHLPPEPPDQALAEALYLLDVIRGREHGTPLTMRWLEQGTEGQDDELAAVRAVVSSEQKTVSAEIRAVTSELAAAPQAGGRAMIEVQQEVSCLVELGDLRASRADDRGARWCYEEALELNAGRLDSVAEGRLHRSLARVSEHAGERARHVRAARRLWTSGGREELLDELQQEFSDPQDDPSPTAERQVAVDDSDDKPPAPKPAPRAATRRVVTQGTPVVVYPDKRAAGSGPKPAQTRPEPEQDTPQPAPGPEGEGDDDFDTGEYRAIRDSEGLPRVTQSKALLRLASASQQLEPPAPAKQAHPETVDLEPSGGRGAGADKATGSGPLPPVEMALSLPGEFVARGELVELEPGDVVITEYEPCQRLFLVRSGRLELHKALSQAGGSGGRIGVLEAGAVFGESALLGDGANHYSVRALTRCRCQSYEHELVRQLLGELPVVAQELRGIHRHRLQEATLTLCPILRPLPPARARALLERFSPLELSAGQEVIHQGDGARGLYLIATGEVEASCADDRGGPPVLLHRMSEGDFFGEISLLLDKPSPAAFTARTAAQLLHIPAAIYRNEAWGEPALRTLMEIEARRRDQKYRAVQRGEEQHEVGTTVRQLARGRGARG